MVTRGKRKLVPKLSKKIQLSIEIILNQIDGFLIHLLSVPVDEFDAIVVVGIMACGNHDTAVKLIHACDIGHGRSGGDVKQVCIRTRAMIDSSRVQNYYIACGYTDMRKQIDGLASLVQTQFGQEMDETSLYLFCGRRADRIKALYWDGTGYILLYKRLTEKRFQWPRNESEMKKLTLQEFRWLMEGLSITQTKAFVPGKPGTVC